MPPPSPRLPVDGPVVIVSARALFRGPSIRHRQASSLVRLGDGRLLLVFRLGRGPARGNDGAVMLSASDDGGAHWSEPHPLYAYPGWDCLPLGGLCHFADDCLVAYVGRLRFDASLGGEEPLADWYLTATMSRDGGSTWSDPGPEIRLFPGWTELYGASNPHPLADGRALLACMGTLGRDTGWQAGVTTTDAQGQDFTPPVIIAAAPDRDYSDIDLVRLADGRFLAVIREHLVRDSVFAHSADEGRTWSAIQPTGFQGSNIKLLRLRSGAVLCVYRDEDPARRGVSCSLSEDGGTTWRFVGQLYVADEGTAHQPGTVCGYPDLVYTSADEIAAVLHTYPDAAGHIDLHVFRLRDQTA